MRGKLLAATALCSSVLFLVPGVVFAQSTYDWSGAYLGGTLGIVSTESEITTTASDPLQLFGNGGLAGITVGYNFALNDQFVVGIEADGSFSSLESDTRSPLVPFGASANEKLDSLLTLRGRLGITQGPVMAYATLGLAGGNASYSASVVDLGKSGVPAEGSGFVTGVVGGAGVEVAVSDNISVKGEGLMYQMSPLTASGDTGKGAFDSEYKASGTVIRTGVNLHF